MTMMKLDRCFGFGAALGLLSSTSAGAFSLSMVATTKPSPADALKGLISKVPTPSEKPVLNPIQFGSKLIESEAGKEAAAQLIDGGVTIAGAILEEGKSAKILVPTGFDRNGNLLTRVVNNFGPGELAGTGLFAASEALQVGSRLYQGKGDYRPAKFKLTLPSRKPEGVVSPVDFALKVAGSVHGKDATGKLVDGGLKLVKLIIEEGGKYKVRVPTGYTDYRTGKPTFTDTSVGVKELIDLGLFAGSEAFATYNKLYFGDTATQIKRKLNFVPERRDTKGRLVTRPAVEYSVNVGGKRIKVS